MLANQFALLLRLFLRPAQALSDILDRGRWFAALALCAVIALALSFALSPLEHRVRTIERLQEESVVPAAVAVDPAMQALARTAPFVSGLKIPLVLVLVFAPVALAAGRLIGGGRVLDQMVPLSTCLGFAYAAAYLPAAILFLLVPLPLLAWLLLLGVGTIFFLWLASASVRMVLGGEVLSGVIGAASGAVASLLAAWFLGKASFLSGFLFSPFVLYFLYMRFSGSVSGLADPFRQQQNFRRYLEASTINPHDADAHYQLGLIYQRRHQYSPAIDRFEKAIAIDPSDVDAHYQLARVYKEQERWADALPQLEASIKLDSRHAQFEPARDWAIAKLHLGDPANARITLESYIEQRPYDPEALFYLGQVLVALGEKDRAREFLERAREAVRTTPGYRRHEVRKWGREASALLRSL